MSDQDNPYKAPDADAAATVPEGDLNLPDQIREPLLASAPWIRFIGIMGFVASGLLAIVGLAAMFGLSAMYSALDMAGMGAGMAVFMGLLYIGIAVLYFFPSLFLFRSGRSLKDFQNTSLSGDLTASLVNTGKFWKYVGVLAIIYLGIMAFGLVIFAIVAMAS